MKKLYLQPLAAIVTMVFTLSGCGSAANTSRDKLGNAHDSVVEIEQPYDGADSVFEMIENPLSWSTARIPAYSEDHRGYLVFNSGNNTPHESSGGATGNGYYFEFPDDDGEEEIGTPTEETEAEESTPADDSGSAHTYPEPEVRASSIYIVVEDEDTDEDIIDTPTEETGAEESNPAEDDNSDNHHTQSGGPTGNGFYFEFPSDDDDEDVIVDTPTQETEIGEDHPSDGDGSDNHHTQSGGPTGNGFYFEFPDDDDDEDVIVDTPTQETEIGEDHSSDDDGSEENPPVEEPDPSDEDDTPRTAGDYRGIVPDLPPDYDPTP